MINVQEINQLIHEPSIYVPSALISWGLVGCVSFWIFSVFWGEVVFKRGENWKNTTLFLIKLSASISIIGVALLFARLVLFPLLGLQTDFLNRLGTSIGSFIMGTPRGYEWIVVILILLIIYFYNRLSRKKGKND